LQIRVIVSPAFKLWNDVVYFEASVDEPLDLAGLAYSTVSCQDALALLFPLPSIPAIMST
jgi:hypothetical protein